MAQTLKQGAVGSIAYTLTVDGEVIESISLDEAIEYLHGAENIVPGLEEALTGKKAGDTFKVTIAPADGYGEYDQDEVEEIERDKFTDFDELYEGLEIEIMDDKGDLFEATVLEVGEKSVRVDFNPPLAGKTLLYEGKVVSVRDASPEELEIGFPASLIEELFGDDDFEDDEDFDDEDDK